MVGEYFCSPNPEPITVYTEFVHMLKLHKYKSQHPFSHSQKNSTAIDIDDVWRILLSHFTMPKEAQQVERLLNVISAVYYPISGLKNETAVYQFAFTAMMVQTSTTNPNIKEKEKLKLADFMNFCNLVEGGV